MDLRSSLEKIWAPDNSSNRSSIKGYRDFIFDGIGIELTVVNTEPPSFIFFFFTSKTGDANGLCLDQRIEVGSILATCFTISAFCIGEYLSALMFTGVEWVLRNMEWFRAL